MQYREAGKKHVVSNIFPQDILVLCNFKFKLAMWHYKGFSRHKCKIFNHLPALTMASTSSSVMSPR